MTSHAIEVVGWIGALLMLLAYGLLSARRMSSDSPAYQVMNILGSAGFVLNSGWNGAFPSAALNVVWMGIGTVALLRLKGSPRPSTFARGALSNVEGRRHEEHEGNDEKWSSSCPS